MMRMVISANLSEIPIGDQNVARPSGCRIETRLDAWPSEVKKILRNSAECRWIHRPEERRDESRRRRHECPRHV
jgi:hypothetical protein